jgi:hypothetical protein
MGVLRIDCVVERVRGRELGRLDVADPKTCRSWTICNMSGLDVIL